MDIQKYKFVILRDILKHLLPSPQLNIDKKIVVYDLAAVDLVSTCTSRKKGNSVDDIKDVYTEVFGTPKVNT